jgi:hypothetical protein
MYKKLLVGASPRVLMDLVICSLAMAYQYLIYNCHIYKIIHLRHILAVNMLLKQVILLQTYHYDVFVVS